MLVEYTINVNNLFVSGEWDNVNEEASGDNYREMVRQEIAAYFDNEANVSVDEIYNGNDNLYVQNKEGNDVTDEHRAAIEHIAGKVFGDMDWVIYND